VAPPLVSPSATPVDVLTGPGQCGTPAPGADAARCGFGPRLPLLVISPFAKSNFVDHTLTNQASVLRFIEDNWKLGFIDGPRAPAAGTGSFDRFSGSLINMFEFHERQDQRKLILDPVTGTVVSDASHHDDSNRDSDHDDSGRHTHDD
jgi:phospholipase C